MLKIRKGHRAVGIAASICAVILFGSIINPAAKNQESAEAITDLTGETAITMTSINNAASITIDPSKTGVFATTSGANDISFSVATSNYTGYALSVRSTKTTIDKDDNSFTSLASSVTAEQFSTSSNTTLNNRWGFKPNFYNSESNSRYFGVSTTAVTLDRTSTANTTAKNYTISLGARADTSLPSGTYINENLILEATANIIPSSILTVNYSTGVTGVTVGGVTIANGETVKLIRGASYPINMTYDQTLYSFDSWSATSGTIGSSNTQSTTYAISTTDATLTANVAFIGSDMQNLSSVLCTSTPRLVKDNRDNHIYTVQRLDDGNCWMMENLDLGRTPLTTNLTSANTNISSTVTTSTFNGWRKTSGNATNIAGELIPIEGTDATSGTAYGTLYNYYAASAGTITGGTNTSDAQYDICPAGWRLPTGGSTGEFQALYAEYNSNALMRAPVANSGAAFALSGDFTNSTPTSQGNYGYYWSSKRDSSTYMYNLVVSTSYVSNGVSPRYSGYAIRCILKKQISDLNYLQDFKNLTKNELAGITASMAENTTYNLTDNRDNRVYAVAKLKDGRIWMAENLNLGRTTLTTDLTSANTNTFASVTASTFNSWKKTTSSASLTSGVFVSLSGTDSTTGTSYGTLYNYYAASAGTVAGNAYDYNAHSDICPAGWRLPIESEVNSLDSNYSGSSMHSAIANGGAAFPYSGEFSQSSLQSQGESGSYWTSTATGYSDSMWMYSNDDWGGLEYEANRNLGAAVRCVARKPSHTITIAYDGTSVTQVDVSGTLLVPENTSITLEEGMSYSIDAVVATGYSFTNWSATSGTIGSTTSQSTTFTVGTSDATITATASFNGYTMQNLSLSNCTTTPSYVKDTRDNHIYTVQRLDDGRCWMMENLDLGSTTLTTNLTSTNTNIATTVDASTFNGWKKTSGSLSFDDGEFINVSGTDSTSGTPYGTLYNYVAASAGTITGSTHEYDALYDICPAGWRLPVGDSWGEFGVLYSNSSYNTLAKMRAGIADGGAAFALAGYFGNSTPTNQGSSASYWSSMRSSGTNRYSLYLNTSSVTPNSSSNRSYGRAIRCILKKSTHTVTVSYGTGITDVTINGVSVANNGTITLEESTRYVINASLGPGYSFSSWTATTGSIDTASSDSTYLRSITGNTTLTAAATFSGPFMQNMSSSICTSTPTTVYDNRDMHSYTIQRLIDGNCWMTQSLDLGRTALTTDLTSSNTNISTTVTASTFNSWKTTSGTDTYDAGEFINITGNDPTSDTPYGTLYNFYTASAGTITGSTTDGNVIYDICPAGWRLPTGGQGEEFDNLYNLLYQEYGSGSVLNTPTTSGGAGFTLDGIFMDGAPYSTGTRGTYWSSTASDNTKMSYLLVTATGGNPYSLSNRSAGRSVRCVLKKQISDLAYLQDFKNLKKGDLIAVANSMADSTTYNLIDNRDNKSYSIAKMKDGRIWMAENLDLGRETLLDNLTADNTNYADNATYTNFDDFKKTSGTQTFVNGEFINVSGTDPTSGTPYGTLYNYAAATMRNISGSTNNKDAIYDICPAGWRLPTGGNTGEFRALSLQYNSNALMRAPIANGGAAFALAGYFTNSTPTLANSVGRYWATTRYSNTEMYGLSLDTSSVYPVNISSRDYGYAIRCIVKKPLHTLKTSIGTGVSRIIIRGSNYLYNNSTIQLEEGETYTIDVELSSGYSFTGWSTTSGTIGSTTTQSTTFTMGAMDATLTVTAGESIQNISSNKCTSTPSQVVDARDNHTYTIQRLNDGRCWMMENLDLGRSALTTDLTSSNTNLSTTVTASTFNSWKKTSGSATYDAGEFISTAGSDATSDTAFGTLYNYYAASAGTISGSNNTNSPQYDICPAGWRLPTGGNFGEFSALYQKYNSYALMRASVANGGAAFALAGSFSNSTPTNWNNGYYWSSTRLNSYVRNMSLSTSTVDPTNSLTYGYTGKSIRCILDEPLTISNITYMQHFKELSSSQKATVLASMADSTTYDLIDNRDNRTYKVAKMKDGKIWMAENLDLGRTTLTNDLTITNTNISSTITASTFNGWKKTSGTNTYTAGEFINTSGTDSTSGTAYGTLYNYYAASAGTKTGNSNSSSAYEDICPAGWRLPTGGTSGETRTIYQQYSASGLMRASIANGGAGFVLSGLFFSNVSYQGTSGYYWTSTWSSSENMDIMSLTDSGTSFGGSARSNGVAIRCVAK
ncbi:hypothetical protein IJI89_00080 [Candidatus Saccharibacteria bacterium]|nr:hypothetical protein [Candidatus Saccharibacteria bacterium]